MEILWCSLDRESETPLYEQLYSHIKKGSCQWRAYIWNKTAFKTKLSDYLKISQNTVESTYEQLVAEGYVEVVARKGFFVQAYENLEYVDIEKDVGSIEPLIDEKIRYDFHPTRIDPYHFPIDRWRKHMKDTLDHDHLHLFLLGHHQGELAFREEIAHYLRHSRGVTCEPSQIIVGAGIEVLMQQLFQLIGRSKTYGIEDPGYQLMRNLLTNSANQYVPLTVDEEGIVVDSILDSSIDVICTTPSHHFPYGTVLSINRRKRLLQWANEKRDRYILEDDYDSEFRYSGKTIPSLQSMDHFGKVIYLGTFSKSLIPSARISYMVLPNDLLKHYKEVFSFYHSTVSRIDQVVLTEFMKQGDFAKHLNRMRKIYRRKLDIVLQELKPYEDSLTIIGERSGLHVVLVITNGMTETELVEAALSHQLLVYPLSRYTVSSEPSNPPRIVLGFAGIPEDELKEALQTLLLAWNYEYKKEADSF
ncbi:LOW QUALITY PROTEIN: predicted transcriptional regulator of pyridoxine metabolism [Geomicrobium sp. JCM 19055]|nr:LOW QUALITY PROTEIN: predicted transcriptional regulator of pyridoxine metabolism [Geomicrobium sp. JCM 19055]